MNNQDDIPVFQRTGTTTAKAPQPAPARSGGPLLVAFLGILLAAGGVGFFLLGRSQPPAPASPAAMAKTAPAPKPAASTLLGHRRFREARAPELAALDAAKVIYAHKNAVARFKQMAATARADGVILVPLSAFRGEKHQQELFLRQLGRAGTADAATTINAPPGYSEHHTGYALDLGDGKLAGTNLQLSFDRTPAFRWLQANAGKFGFELSFPLNNPQKVSYEPWHWRYVGDRQALETFYGEGSAPR